MNTKMKIELNNKITCSELAIEPWQVSNNTRLESPNIGWACSLSLREFMSSQPVIKTRTAPGLSFSQIWHRRYSMRLKPIQSGFQHDNDSLVWGLYSLKLATLSASWLHDSEQEKKNQMRNLHSIKVLVVAL